MSDELVKQALNAIQEVAASLKDLVITKPFEQPRLKPCPFCGGRAWLQFKDRPDPPSCYMVWLVRCIDCGARTKDFPTGNYYGLNATPEEVAQAWNRRPNE